MAGTAASPGDYLLFEQNETLLDGRVIALADAGQVVLGSAARRRGHYLVQTDGGDEPPLALVESEVDVQAVAAAYSSDRIEVRTRLIKDVRVLGHALLLMRGAVGYVPPDASGPGFGDSPGEAEAGEQAESPDPPVEAINEVPEQGGSSDD